MQAQLRKHPSFYRWVMLLLISLPAFGTNYAQFQLSAFASEFMSENGITTAQFSAVVLSFTFVTGIVGVAGGTLADRFGVRRTAVVCGFITGAASLLRLLTHSYWLFFALSLFTGTFLGCINAVSGKIIRMWFPERLTARAFAIYAAIGAVGISLAQFMAPVYSSYRQALLVSGFMLLAAALLWVFLGSDAPKGVRVPRAESFFAHLARVVKLRNMWIVALGMAFFNALIYSLSALLPTALSSYMGMAENTASRTASVLNIAAIIGMIIIPILQARTGRYRPWLMGVMILAAVLTASIWYAPGGITLPLVFLAGFFISVGAPFLMSTLSSLPELDTAWLGSATGLVTLVQYVFGGFILPSMAIAPLLERSGSALFICSGALALLIALAAVFLPETGSGKR